MAKKFFLGKRKINLKIVLGIFLLLALLLIVKVVQTQTNDQSNASVEIPIAVDANLADSAQFNGYTKIRVGAYENGPANNPPSSKTCLKGATLKVSINGKESTLVGYQTTSECIYPVTFMLKKHCNNIVEFVDLPSDPASFWNAYVKDDTRSGKIIKKNPVSVCGNSKVVFGLWVHE